jgi:hypothetical protein
MDDLVSQLQLQFGVEAPQSTFALEVDDLDALLNSPIRVEPFRVFNWYWSDEALIAQYENQEILKVLANGYSHVRLYAPTDIEVDIFCTEPPVRVKSAAPILYPSLPAYSGGLGYLDGGIASRAYAYYTTSYLGAAPPDIVTPSFEYVGKREALVWDIIEFNNARTAAMKYNYVKKGFETAYASAFVTKDGRSIAPPEWVPDLNGLFILKEPATGSMVLRYFASYRLYKVNYGMAAGIEYPYLQLAWLKGDIKKFPMPLVKVFAIARAVGRAASADFKKEVFPKGADLATWSMATEENKSAELTLTEGSRTVATTRIESDSDPSQYIDVEALKSVQMFDSSGRPYTLRFK